ncbi:MAG: NAD(+) synthase [Lachnospiraceae bacterium]|nr:NAD(+) synthase [Lachnospiraceae bacterium]
MFNAETQKQNVINWIREWFSENGPKADAVLGISGGKDSTITAALMAEALGKDRVVGVLMPNGIQPDINDSEAVIEHLGIRSHTVDISPAVDALMRSVGSVMGSVSEDTKINIPPRVRMTVLYAIAQSLQNGGRVINTCNRSEDYIGYSTKYGDAAGDMSPLSGFTVSEVKEIGRLLDIPHYLVDKTPSDGLSGLSDEDKIGFTYEVLDRYILTGECEDEKIREKIDRMHRINLHKLKVIPSYKPV